MAFKMRFTKKIYGSPIINLFIAQVEGQKTHTRPFAWVGGDKKYSHITGGIILPTFDQPGFLLTVGTRHESNIIDCLDEFESHDPYDMIRKAQAIQTAYGEGVIGNWWGNPVELMSIVNDINIVSNPVYIADPIDADQPDAFYLYLSQMRISLSESNQIFRYNDCNLLKNHVRSFSQEKAKEKDYPAIYITGALIHTLLLT
ncbi:MAG: hypothetical protein ABIJ37_07270, partial [Pseudomonadota bacterium]